MVRPYWRDLSGAWEFDYDDSNAPDRTAPGAPFSQTITVPYPPESPLSGIGDTGYHPVAWYRRHITSQELAAAGFKRGRRLLLHFGAVDYRADVWAGGQHVGQHEGGHTPFTVDVTKAADGEFDVVVRAEDDPRDLEQPRGKQDWELRPHVIWYERTTGIWQPVWLETVPVTHIIDLGWQADIVRGQVVLSYELSEVPDGGSMLAIEVWHEGVLLACTTTQASHRAEVIVSLTPGWVTETCADLLWSPEHPCLLDARVSVMGPDGTIIDEVVSYFGMRSVSTTAGSFMLNGQPYYVRAVLSQGYWPQSHLAAPDPDALRAEVQVIKDLGFNTARMHQKPEDPRFLFWADKLGLLVWDEMPSAYEFSSTSIKRLTSEWQEVMHRDRSHPCVAVWVPMNESWGAQQAARRADERDFLAGLYCLTKAIDPSRPVVSNDGWEHTESDLLTIHDYENDSTVLSASYADETAVAKTTRGVGPGGRVVKLLPPELAPNLESAPVILSEFGGVCFENTKQQGAWGYHVVNDAIEYERQLRAVFGAVQHSQVLAGWCYTQLTDTMQETNGLLDSQRRPKLDPTVVASVVQGVAAA